MNADDIIAKLKLEPLKDEGGYFRRIYTHKDSHNGRALASAIYFLITSDQFSALHRIDSDELFHFISGGEAIMLQLHPNGSASEHLFGTDLNKGQTPTCLVPGNTWQGLRLADNPGNDYALFSVSVHPAFEWSRFELADSHSLITSHPAHENEIKKLIRK